MTTADIAPGAVLLPDPEPRPVLNTIISVDDHLVEPPHMFEGRLPAALQADAPRVIETPEGHEVWLFEGRRYTQIGMNAVAGRRRDLIDTEPVRFEHMRRGCWDIHERVRDMDLNGIWASLNFPSMIAGFCGRVFSGAKAPELGKAVVRAWNDWLFDEWYSPYPDRIIPLGITYLSDPREAATEIRRNAARGFRTVSLPERPQNIGYPSLFTDYWQPVIEACVETGTVISLHVGSSGGYEAPVDAPDGAPTIELRATMFGSLSMAACAEWIWSLYPDRYPDLQVALSEGGIGWVPMLKDRLTNMVERSGFAGRTWKTAPVEALARNFYFCTIDDPTTIELRHAVGVDRIMVEVDYPHADSTWPDTQQVISDAWGHIDPAERRAMCCANAARVYRHPLPEHVLP
jgi:predicted TIM-barrel fold metal-dependent hydrolase